MQDKLLIITKIKKTIEYIEKATSNYPHIELILKTKIMETSFELLETAHRANILKDLTIMSDVIVKLRMLEYYIKRSLDKKLISFKKYEIIGNFLLEINKMVNCWVKYEKSK